MKRAFVNIANYAYPDKDGSVEVSCEHDEHGALVITLSDSGQPFDLLAAAAPSLEDNVSEREVGGLGIFLIKKVMDDVSYKRVDDKNVLTLTAGQR